MLDCLNRKQIGNPLEKAAITAHDRKDGNKRGKRRAEQATNQRQGTL